MFLEPEPGDTEMAIGAEAEEGALAKSRSSRPASAASPLTLPPRLATLNMATDIFR